MLHQPRSKRLRLAAVLAFAILGPAALMLLESHFQPMARDGIYFQRWTSEVLVQTVSVEDLRDEPLTSLWNIHIQPPVLDATRAVLTRIFRSPDPAEVLRRVDRALYVLWALLFGQLGAVVFWWLSARTAVGYAFVCTGFLLAHPATILYVTLLDTTFLTAVLTLALFYLLWRVKAGLPAPPFLLAMAFLALFFTRSLFQWQWLPLLALSLVLLRYPTRGVALFLLAAAPAVALYTAKQISLFGLSGTSSFVGRNLCRSIGRKVPFSPPEGDFALDPGPVPGKPRVLTRVRKLDGAVNFNNQFFVLQNQHLLREFRTTLSGMSIPVLARTYLVNARIFWRPSSHYSRNVIVDRMPHRAIYDRLFSAPIFPGLLVAASVSWAIRNRRGDFRSPLGLLLPVAAVVFLAIVCERGENQRFKYFVEPVLIVFLVAEAHAAWRTWMGRLSGIPSPLGGFCGPQPHRGESRP